MNNHFYESMERKINFQREYNKLEELITCEEIYTHSGKYSINTWIEINFRAWKKKKNYISFAELRDHLGFNVYKNYDGFSFQASNIDINRYLLFCEMIFNISIDLGIMESEFQEQFNDVIGLVSANLELLGLEWKTVSGEMIIVEKNAAAIEAATIEPTLADAITEYNQYLLKGNLGRKKELLFNLIRGLEPYRNELKNSYKGLSDDFFFLANKLDIRHNNVNPADKSDYYEIVANLSCVELEEWYDLIYEQGLILILLLHQKERTERISVFKRKLGE